MTLDVNLIVCRSAAAGVVVLRCCFWFALLKGWRGRQGSKKTGRQDKSREVRRDRSGARVLVFNSLAGLLVRCATRPRCARSSGALVRLVSLHITATP